MKLFRKSFLPLLILFSACCVWAQPRIIPSAGTDRLRGIEEQLNTQQPSLVNRIPVRNIGPTIMSGRAVDVDVNPEDPTEFYVAYASGGLWYTHNNGQSFRPVFDKEAAITIGDFAVDWKRGRIWVGTGEVNSSRSSYAGTGVYLSVDSGKTWQYKGLPESHHIGKIRLHPDNPDVVWIAVLGHLYSPNLERGVFKTSDGGKSWNHVLAIDDNCGAVDLVVNPKDPNVLYAASWHRERRAWNIVEGGGNSGIFKSTDGGENWRRITLDGSGFPTGENIGRIGLTISSNNPDLLYAVVDNQNKRKEEEIRDTSELDVKDLKGISKSSFLAIQDKKLESFLKRNRFPEKYTTEIVRNLVRSDSISPADIVDYLNDANNSLFDSPIIGAEIYRTVDGGKSWKKTHDHYLKELFYTYGYYFGKIAVSPLNDDKIVVCGVPLIQSVDGGKSFKTIDGDNVHGDHHAVWMSSVRDGHLINCNDGGVNISYDDGATWFKANSPPVGQFYTVTVDMDTPYNVYGGLQDNGVWTGPSDNSNQSYWLQYGQYPFKFIMGGDGMQVQVDTRDNSTVYTGFQFGNYYRIDKNNPHRNLSIKPRNDIGSPNYRFNWQTPVCLSRHNQDILYLGSNHFHRSLTRGENMEVLSEDLTRNDKKGDVPFNTITTIAESPMRFGMIYCGTDDGRVWRSKDVGYSWEEISAGLPVGLYVSRISASAHQLSRVYVTMNGYRNDHFTAYAFVSENEGETWTAIAGNLPPEPLNVIREDLVNPDVLYVGSDNGLYVSLNRGKQWIRFSQLPRVAVHDLVIHPREQELVIATHGRSIYIVSLKELQTLNDSLLAKDFVVFDVDVPKYSKAWGKKEGAFDNANPARAQVSYLTSFPDNITLEIRSEKGLVLQTVNDSLAQKGLNYFDLDLVVSDVNVKNFNRELAKTAKGSTLVKAEDNKYYLPPGTYSLRIRHRDGVFTDKKFEIINAAKKY